MDGTACNMCNTTHYPSLPAFTYNVLMLFLYLALILGGLDFVSLEETIVFLPGETEKTVTVEIVRDNLIERDELFTVTAVYFISTTAGLQRREIQAQILIRSEGQCKFD